MKRLNLALEQKMFFFLEDISWQNRTNKTQWLRDLIQKEMDKTKPATGNTATGVNDYDGF
jgi:hypothetical protein